MKIVKRILLSLFGLILIIAIAVFFYLQSIKPNLNASLNIPGLKDKVEVIYDNFGVPHIYAKNEEDAYLAFGYVHAQDRLFQMEIVRRLADGRLAELFGDKALASDKFFRTLSFRKHAQWSNDSLKANPKNANILKASEAYIKGVNEYIKNGKTPLEFTIIGIPKTDFTLDDMQIITGYMGFTFADAFKSEAIATMINAKFGPEYLNDLMSQWPDSQYKIPTQKQENIIAANNLAKMANEIASIESDAFTPPFHGSNGWVVSGSKTKSGKPILSNDTHIAFSQPSVWYEAHLEYPGFQFYGNFLAGTPFAALGHSQFGGWGLTMFENDDVDFFREKVNPVNPDQVWYKGKWENMEIREEMIKVKDKPDVVIKVKKSNHGIIMNDSFDKMADQKEPIALWWVFNQFPSRHMEVFYELAHAKNPTDAGQTLSKLTSPGLNFMWADVEGNIAWWAAGKLPIRSKNVNSMVILDGSTGNDDPMGWADFSLNPQIINPKSGVLYTANNQPADMGNGLIPGYYVASNRAQRIQQLIFTDKKDWTKENMRPIINDIISPSYVEVLKDILPILKSKKLSNSSKKAIEILKKWDGNHALNAIEPTIFYRFINHFAVSAISDELGPEVFKSFEKNNSFKRNMNAFLRNDNSLWWDNINTKNKETRAEILTKSMNDAIADLEKTLGNDMKTWVWSDVHTLTHKHPLGILPIIGKYFNVGPLPTMGGSETINNQDFPIDSSGKYHVSSGPALRRIIDFADTKHGQSVLPTGQSGNVMSKHYSDQAKMFVEGGSRPELMDKNEILKNSTGKMVLSPK
jgi:penicillin G amidase